MIRPEQESDRDAVWSVHRAAFENGAEANLVDTLRDGGFVEVSLVAELDGRIVGHILFSSISIVTETVELAAVSLATMAVLPSRQRQGIGSQLVRAGVQNCRNRGHRIAVVLGHPDFYLRFGFSSELARRLESPFGGGDAWMAQELVPGAVSNIRRRVRYPFPFDAV